jgi:hypothetical protein
LGSAEAGNTSLRDQRLYLFELGKVLLVVIVKAGDVI